MGQCYSNGLGLLVALLKAFSVVFLTACMHIKTMYQIQTHIPPPIQTHILHNCMYVLLQIICRILDTKNVFRRTKEVLFIVSVCL